MKLRHLAVSILLFGWLVAGLHAGTLQQYIEAETLQGIDGDSWQKMGGDAALAKGQVSGASAALFRKGGDFTQRLTGELSRPLGVLEKVRIFCRVLPPVGDQPAWITVRSGGGEANFRIQAVADPEA